MSASITVTELEALEAPVVVDVREPDEYADGHVPGALDIPLGRLGARMQELPRERDLVLICASGHRSAQGAAFLNEQGVAAVSVDGGMRAWRAAGLPVERGARG